MREEENNQSSQSSSFKRFFKKRWVYPAIYIASAALILTGVLWYQMASNNSADKYDYKSSDLTSKKYHQKSVEVSRALENFAMPVKNTDQAVVEKKFYDFNGKKADQEAALVFYNNTYVPNTGVDIGMQNGKTFDVVASLSGTVTKVEEDPLLGNVVEIEHNNGVVTQYESVKDMKVAVGDQVSQGQVIAKAGQSLLNEKAGTHVHFEIRKDGIAVNPETYFNKPLSSLKDEKPAGDDVNANQNQTIKQKNLDQPDGTTEENSTDGNSLDNSSTTNDQNS